jgi:predicted P-loop ATPase
MVGEIGFPLPLLHRIARRYAEIGLAVFPLGRRSKIPAISKEQGGHGCLDATTDTLQIDRWWSDEPERNIGIACGEKSGVWVLDVDGPGGESALAALVQEHGPLPETPEQTTGKGRHLIFRWTAGIGNRGGTLGVNEFKRKCPGLDVRGEGGYIVAAPSVHPSGAAYAWHEARRPSLMAFAEAPQWLLDMIIRPEPVPGSVAAPQVRRQAETGRASRYGEKALDGECGRIRAAPSGTQDNTLVERAFVIGQLVGGGEIEEGYARQALIGAGMGMAASREPWTIDVVTDKVQRAMAAGMAEPRKAPPRAASAQRPAGGAESAQTGETGEAGVRSQVEAVTISRPIPQVKPVTQAKPATVTPITQPKRSYDADEAWRARLLYKDGDTLFPKLLNNASVMIECHPEMRGVFAFDQFARQVVVARRPHWEAEDGTDWEPRAVTNYDALCVQIWLEREELRPRLNDTHDAIAKAAEAVAFNPVTDWLDVLEWDREPRLDGWLSYYLGAGATEFARAAGAKWLIGAVARAYRPGCKMDTMLILEGPQGIGKSTALRTMGTLGGRSYFTDEITDIGSKDAAMQLQGVMIVEMGELDVLDRSETRSLNAWITRTVDRYRPPYGRLVVEAPRQCVLCGSINPVGDGYLKDPTGARRFWPVACTAVDIEALTRDRDQLWAEAVARFKAGESWWLAEDQVTHAKAEQAQRYQTDPWADKINDMLRTVRKVKLSVIINDWLDIMPAHQSWQVERRVAKHLRSVGWESTPARTSSGGLERVWVPINRQMEIGEES